MMSARHVTRLADALQQVRVNREVHLVAATVLAYAVAVYLAVSLARNAAHVALIWPANGILLAGLLSCGRGPSRKFLIAAALPAGTAAFLLNGDTWGVALPFTAINIGESLLAYRLLRAACGHRVVFTRIWSLARFVAICFIAPVVPAVLGAILSARAFGVDWLDALTTWYLADSLGLLVLTPTILLIRDRSGRSGPPAEFHAVALHAAWMVAVSLIVFAQSSVPLLFLVIPVSVLIAFRLGSRYAAMATLWLTLVSVVATSMGWGPAALMEDTATRIWVAQLFCFVNLLTSLTVAAELSERDQLRRELERMSTLASERRRQLDTALDAMSQGVCLFDPAGRVSVRNTRFLEIYGLPPDAVPPGTPLSGLKEACVASGAVPERDIAAADLIADNDVEQELQDGRFIRIGQRLLADGGVICTYTDFTAEKRAEDELLHRTLHDPLTGLPNRSLLVSRIDQAMEKMCDANSGAVMLLDVDYFKSVNDNHGHAAGDALLKVIGERLRSAVRDTDTVARLGGDEFAILLAAGEHASDAALVARRILDTAAKPIVIEGRPMRAGLSIGIARPPADGATTDEILKAADIALYKAKRSGRGKFAFFDAAEDAGVCSARRLESELRRAVDEEEFRVVYQPIVTGASGAVAAYEALLRWEHPELGVISPADFVPLAERNGLIVKIGDWVLERACADAVRMPPTVTVSVNLSRVQISDPGFVSRVERTLARTGLPSERLELEITETAIIDNEENALRTLDELTKLGVSVALDDFGVGQSALSCLRELPISRIKIDRSFISDLPTDPKARSIFVTMATMARSLGMKTTAEGIETEQQRMIAALAGCDHLQGYLLGRPETIERLSFEDDTAKRRGGSVA